MPQPINYDAAHLDLSSRYFASAAVVASPAAAAETIICSLTLSGDLAIVEGVYLWGWAAFTMGTNGVSANLKIRRTDTSGQTVAASGAVTGAAAALYAPAIVGLDAQVTLNAQVYVLTLTCASASAASTVSACQLTAVVV